MQEIEISEVDETNILEAAKIHSESWIDSHESFCTKDFLMLHSIENQKKYLEDKIKEGSKIYILYDNKAVGIISLKENLIEDLYILPSKQHQGYGRILLEFVLKKCEGVPTLWILDNNRVALEMYEKYGFYKTGNKNQLAENLFELEMKMC